MRRKINAILFILSAFTVNAQQYIATFKDGTKVQYTMLDSTVKDNHKLKFLFNAIAYNSDVYSAGLNAVYCDLKKKFMAEGFIGINGDLGIGGTYYPFMKDKYEEYELPLKGFVNNLGYATVSTTYVTKQNIEKLSGWGLHAGYSLKQLSESDDGWGQYYNGNYNQLLTSGQTNVSGPIPVYSQISIGPRFTKEYAYRFLANDLTSENTNETSGFNSALVSHKKLKVKANRKLFSAGADILIFPVKPSLNATYDSLAASEARAGFPNTNGYGFSQIASGYFPNSTFAPLGLRLYVMDQWSWTTSANFEIGIDIQLGLESNLSGFNLDGQAGLYVGFL